MAKTDSFNDWILERLSAVPGIRARRMFGGLGIYAGDTFFGILFEDRLYFFTDDETRDAYIAQGSGPFQPNPRQRLKSYYEVPIEVIEDGGQLVAWAETAVRARRS